MPLKNIKQKDFETVKKIIELKKIFDSLKKAIFFSMFSPEPKSLLYILI